MVRGTTPTHTFSIPLPSSSLENLWLTYAQDGEIILNKDLNDVTLTDVGTTACKATIKLTQAETMLFHPNTETEIQVSILTSDNAMRSSIINVDTERILKDEVIEPAEE